MNFKELQIIAVIVSGLIMLIPATFYLLSWICKRMYVPFIFDGEKNALYGVNPLNRKKLFQINGNDAYVKTYNGEIHNFRYGVLRHSVLPYKCKMNMNGIFNTDNMSILYITKNLRLVFHRD